MSAKANYFIIPLAVSFVAGIGSWLTTFGRNADMWYQTLNLPTWAPDGNVIGIAWTIIFTLTAISLVIIWNRLPHHTPRFKYIIQLFTANAVFNVAWSYLFFVRHNILAALIDAGLIFLSVVGIILVLHTKARASKTKHIHTAAVLLYPYAGWTLFATYLTFIILRLN